MAQAENSAIGRTIPMWRAFAESGLVLVMPEGASSYYTNAVHPPQDRYEDDIVGELISDVESKLPVATGRANRAIAGVSMGGFGR
jgi:S-formylglutathione hydrolase FrmB